MGALAGGTGCNSRLAPAVTRGWHRHRRQRPSSITRVSTEAEHTSRDDYAAERPKAFIDAVVAIAMTLLILPLMESVSEISASNGTAMEWAFEHSDLIVSFVLSFVIIAMFWLNHHRLFNVVDRLTNAALWLLVAWMLTIVWLPVATAISGHLSAKDASAKVIYVGSMILTALLSFAVRTYLARHGELHRATPEQLRSGMAVDLTLALLFGIALLVAVMFPCIGYLSMLVMFANPLVQRAFERVLPLPHSRPRRG